MAHEHSNCTKISVNDPEWELYFGSKLVRARQEYSAGLEPMNADALAAEDLGLLFAYDRTVPYHTQQNSEPPLTHVLGILQDEYKLDSVADLVYLRNLP